MDLRKSYKDAPQHQKELFAKSCQDFLKNISFKYSKYTNIRYDDALSISEEVFSKALNDYDPNKTHLDFIQYCACLIKYKIIDSAGELLNCLRINWYNSNQRKLQNKPLRITKSLERDCYGFVSKDSLALVHTHHRDLKNGDFVAHFDNYFENEPLEVLEKYLESNFSERDIHIFKSYFGLFGIKRKLGKELSKELGLSSGRISQRLSFVISKIKRNDSLTECLRDLL